MFAYKIYEADIIQVGIVGAFLWIGGNRG